MNRGLINDIIKGAVIFTITTLIVSQWFGCSEKERVTAGSAGEVGNAGKDSIVDVKTASVSGRLIDSKEAGLKKSGGKPSEDISKKTFEVYLIPMDSDPVENSEDYWVEVTDESGVFLFEEIPYNTYNIVAKANPSGNMVFIPDLFVEQETYVVPQDTLTKPGSIVVPLGPNNITEFGYVYLPGTNIYSNVDLASDRVVLDSVPYGLYSDLFFRFEGGGDPISVEKDVVVMSGDQVNISLSYCASSGTDPSKLYVTRVQSTSTIYNSDSSGLGYEDFTHKEFSGKQGETLNMHLMFNNPSKVNAEVAIFIDFNRDGVFGAGEDVIREISNKVSENFKVTIPTNADLGKTRMRIKYNARDILGLAAEACETFPTGQVEDYTLFVETSTAL